MSTSVGCAGDLELGALRLVPGYVSNRILDGSRASIGGFHNIFSLGNWRALHHHDAY